MPDFPGRLRTPRLPSAPSSPAKGEMYYDTAVDTLYWWDGTTWKSASGGSAAPEVYVGTAAPTRNQEVIWVDTDESPPAVTRDINMEVMHIVGAAGEPAFQGAWVNTDGAAPTGRYARFRRYPDGRVRLAGNVKSGANGSIIFVLPVGYRPVNTYSFNYAVPNAGNVIAAVTVDTAGQVMAFNWGAGNVTSGIDLSSIEFDTESATQVASTVAVPMEAWHNVGAAGEPIFVNGWVNYDASRIARFRKYPDGRVRLAGVLKSGTASAAAFTLPAGYRPAIDMAFGMPCAPAHLGEVIIGANGTVQIWNYQAGSAVTTFCYLDGIEFDTDSVSSYVAGALPGPALILALPTSPYDGQECYLLVDATNGIIWHLRYRVTSPSVYKWEFIGGGALIAKVNTTEVRTNTAFGDLATVGPQVTAPLAGDYEIDHGAGLAANLAGIAAIQSVQIGATVAVDTDSCYVMNTSTSGTGNYISAATSITKTITAAATVVKTVYRSTGTLNAQHRWLKLRPIRVG